MYFAGQEEEGQGGSGEKQGAFELLKEAADLILAAANHAATTKGPSSSSTFDCSAGLEEWELGWSQMKKVRCCHEVNIPCPHIDSLPDPQSTTTPATTQATSSPVVIPLPQTQVSQGQNMCAAVYQQCGGRNWPGAACCSDGCTCKAYSEYYSQCTPNVPGGTCVAPAASTAIFMVKDSIRNSKTLRGHVEARTSNVLRGWVLVSMCATAFLMIALVAITVHRRLAPQFRPDGDGTAPAGDSDPELPATPQLFFRPAIRTADGNHEPLECLDMDLPLCQERLFQRRPMGHESHRCMPVAFVNQGDSHSGCQRSQEALPSAGIPVRDDRGGFLHI